jgi:hypothetical protein
MSETLDISGLSKTQLLKLLWQNQVVAGFFRGSPGPAYDENAAKEAVTRYIDYFSGRAIKTDLSGDSVDPWMYDRDAGQGTFARIVADLRRGHVAPP